MPAEIPVVSNPVCAGTTCTARETLRRPVSNYVTGTTSFVDGGMRRIPGLSTRVDLHKPVQVAHIAGVVRRLEQGVAVSRLVFGDNVMPVADFGLPPAGRIPAS